MATRLRDAAFEREVRSAIQELSNTQHNQRFSVPSVQAVLQHRGFVAGIDRVARVVYQIEHEYDNEE